MDKEFVPYEIALAFKELGFDEKCGACYYKKFNNEIGYHKVYRDFNFVQLTVSAPTFSQAFRWFREKYGYFQLFDYQHGDSKKNRGYFFNIINIKDRDFFFPENFEGELYKTYEEAELECLRKLIEIVKNK